MDKTHLGEVSIHHLDGSFLGGTTVKSGYHKHSTMNDVMSDWHFRTGKIDKHGDYTHSFFPHGSEEPLKHNTNVHEYVTNTGNTNFYAIPGIFRNEIGPQLPQHQGKMPIERTNAGDRPGRRGNKVVNKMRSDLRWGGGVLDESDGVNLRNTMRGRVDYNHPAATDEGTRLFGQRRISITNEHHHINRTLSSLMKREREYLRSRLTRGRRTTTWVGDGDDTAMLAANPDRPRWDRRTGRRIHYPDAADID